MNVLCDTHILLWAMTGSKKLPLAAKSLIERAQALYFSAASLWEINIKASLGRITIDLPATLDFLEEMNVERLDITWAHACRIQELPFHHHDPFDRMLVAQAMEESLVLLTCDKTLVKYGHWVHYCKD